MSFDEHDDPFTPKAPAENPWEETTNVQQQQNTSAPRPAVVPSEGKVVVTLKGGTGYDAPWIVIHADDADDALKQLNGTLAVLMEKTAQVAKFFHGKLSGAAGNRGGQQQTQQPGGQPGRPANANQSPSGQGVQCLHGAMVFRSGVNQNTGKAWSGHFCPLPKGDPNQCKPKFGN